MATAMSMGDWSEKLVKCESRGQNLILSKGTFMLRRLLLDANFSYAAPPFHRPFAKFVSAFHIHFARVYEVHSKKTWH